MRSRSASGVLITALFLGLASTLAVAQSNSADKQKSQAAPAKLVAQAKSSEPAKTSAQTKSPLETTLDSMDRSAAAMKTVQTDFVWDQYTAVINEHEYQEGTMYFRRNGKNVEMAATINKPEVKHILFTNGTVQIYQPKAEQVTKYNAGKNRDTFESFLVLGFGGRGHDLEKSFDAKYGGPETVNGVATQKLVLTPKSEKVRNMFQTITLWIDPTRGVSVQQKFESSSGDYRLATYKNIKFPAKLPDDIFKLHTTGKTTVITPQG